MLDSLNKLLSKYVYNYIKQTRVPLETFREPFKYKPYHVVSTINPTVLPQRGNIYVIAYN